MITLRPFELALAAAVILAVLEVLTGTFIFLGFCVGTLAVAVTEFVSSEFSLNRDALVFAAFAMLAIVALRFAFGRRGDTNRVKGDVNDY